MVRNFKVMTTSEFTDQAAQLHKGFILYVNMRQVLKHKYKSKWY